MMLFMLRGLIKIIKKEVKMWKEIRKMSHGKKIFFALLIGFAVVNFWRGVWGLMDEYVLPANYRLSLWISLILGIVVLLLTHYASKELM